ncbi:Protein of unknown function [Bacillus mycoides]|nr:Protein of unknown function [Bacillus mycoides]
MEYANMHVFGIKINEIEREKKLA